MFPRAMQHVFYKLLLRAARPSSLPPRCLYSAKGASRKGGRPRPQQSTLFSRTQEEGEELVFVELAPDPVDADAYEQELRLEYQRQREKEEERRQRAEARRGNRPQLLLRGLRLQAEALEPFLRETDAGNSASSDHTLLEQYINFTEVNLSPAPSKTKKKNGRGEHKIFGTPDPLAPVGTDHCPGCGSIMHCIDSALPGYVPSEKYTRILQQKENGEKPERAICQRCFLLTNHQKALELSVPREEYQQIVSVVRQKTALVLFMVDLFDLPNSIISGLTEIIGENKHILVLGNKIDLLPGDSPGYLNHLKGRLLEYCKEAGIDSKGNINNVHLISAKTGYGIEELISNIQKSWKYKGDVYLVGTTNTGKSTLFNTLLESDYCQSKASDVIERATISPWPGTTLNLLKFPIVNPTPHRMFRRMERLQADSVQCEQDLSKEEQKHLRHLKKRAYLIGRVGKTFKSKKEDAVEDIEFDADSLSFSLEEDAKPVSLSKKTTEKLEFSESDFSNAHWLYDTPGIVKENCVLNLLKDKEVKIVLPSHAIIPRTFTLHPGMSLFLGALGRIDFLQGEKSAWFSVVASNLLPIHISTLEKADATYQKHAGQMLLGVPIGGEERMKEFPPLIPEDIILKGIGTLEAVADIKFSSTGWVAVTAHHEDRIHLRGYTPKGTTLLVRQPPLLPHIVHIKGERVRKSAAYATKKPLPLVSNLRLNEKRRQLKTRG